MLYCYNIYSIYSIMYYNKLYPSESGKRYKRQKCQCIKRSQHIIMLHAWNT